MEIMLKKIYTLLALIFWAFPSLLFAQFASNAAPSGLVPNELGRIPVFVYHHIDTKESRWGRSIVNFQSDLEWLYNNNYQLFSLEDFLDNHFDLPYGKKPVIFTFDDGLISQVNYLPDGSIDPNCAIGLMDAFYAKHPDFGRAATETSLSLVLPPKSSTTRNLWRKKSQAFLER